jgi:MFS family permease
MPTFLLAITFLLLRQTLSKLDVPARQAYTMMLVSPEERTAAASFTTTSRSVAVSTSPLVSGLMLSGSIITLGLPILLASCIEISYDAILWIVFRQVPLDIIAKAERKLSTQFHHLHFPGRATYAYSPSWHFAQPLHFGQETLSPRFQPTYTPQTMTSEQFWFLQLPSATTPYRVDPIAVERVQDSSAGF